MIEVEALTKRYRGHLAVDELSFTAEPGRVTAFLGPNGAGKSSTLRAILGLDIPDGGRCAVNGRALRAVRHPVREVGALLDAGAVHPGRSARDHLRWIAVGSGIGAARVDAVLDQVGLAGVADRRVGGFSLGMRQRLGLAAALLGDPGVLILDEPVNGLDPEGIRWIRGLLRTQADEGRTVLVSSHVMSEMEQTADRFVIIGRGRLVADVTAVELHERFGRGVLVRSPEPDRLAGALEAAGAVVRRESDGGLVVDHVGGEEIRGIAAGHGIPLWAASRLGASLEETYLRLTAAAGAHTAEAHTAGAHTVGTTGFPR
ncbi:ABC transporter ATP-binding protein [Streptomyces sp. NPDC059063]|uniref:ABC transporter ATP-binding protein n=1 Tax=unclassified Streptomyces TaxID=2593676 RepID=UPI00368A682F